MQSAGYYTLVCEVLMVTILLQDFCDISSLICLFPISLFSKTFYIFTPCFYGIKNMCECIHSCQSLSTSIIGVSICLPYKAFNNFLGFIYSGDCKTRLNCGDLVAVTGIIFKHLVLYLPMHLEKRLKAGFREQTEEEKKRGKTPSYTRVLLVSILLLTIPLFTG